VGTDPPNKLVSRTVAVSFAGLSRLRGRRIFHPHGVGFRAELSPTDGAHQSELFADPRPRTAIVRLSRSLGLPEALHDPCGLAVRVPDAYGVGRHQDFLLVSSGGAPALRHLILPSAGFAGRPYSSLLPYRIDGRLFLVGAAAAAPAPGPSLGELRGRSEGELDFELRLARLGGRWHPVARLSLGERLPAGETEALRFDPANTGGGLEPAGPLHRLRPPAYGGSQEGRAA
jgi:hypothetical protein